MIDINKELEWVREDRKDRHIGSISKHECVVDVYWVKELLIEVKRLREKIQLLHDTWFTDAEMASDVDERMTELLKEMIE